MFSSVNQEEKEDRTELLRGWGFLDSKLQEKQRGLTFIGVMYGIQRKGSRQVLREPLASCVILTH